MSRAAAVAAAAAAIAAFLAAVAAGGAAVVRAPVAAAAAAAACMCSLSTPRVSRHLAVARGLQSAATAAASDVSLLLLDESYTTWRALRRQSERQARRKTHKKRQLDPAAACELLHDLLAAAAAPEGPTNVLRLGPLKGPPVSGGPRGPQRES